MDFSFTRQGGRALALVLTAICCFSAPAFAETITITLDDVSVGSCWETWFEGGCPLWFTETTDGDLTPGFCLYVADANNFGLEGVYIWPGSLALDLSGIEGLLSVEVDIFETHFAGSTRARMFNEGVQRYIISSYQEGHQTLDMPGYNADFFVISAHEAYVWEIRLIGDNLVTNESASFGWVKSLYR